MLEPHRGAAECRQAVILINTMVLDDNMNFHHSNSDAKHLTITLMDYVEGFIGQPYPHHEFPPTEPQNRGVLQTGRNINKYNCFR